MPLNTMKVYFDGSHYIGIPHKERPKREKEEIILQDEEMAVISPYDEDENEPVFDNEVIEVTSDVYASENVSKNAVNFVDSIEQSLGELFEELYRNSIGKKRSTQREYILKNILKHVNNIDIAEKFVDEKLEKKLRNLIVRRLRLWRKLSLNDFNYFVTFTYDDKLQSEESFKNRLRTCLSHYSNRRGWQYAGVWEGKAQDKRLHFHGIFNIPEGTMPGELIEKNDYSIRLHKRKKTTSNTFFEKKFGRCDFDRIETPVLKGEAMRYLIKYIEKTEEKIVYSRGLARYILSDVENEDVVCAYDEFETKYILYDDFNC